MFDWFTWKRIKFHGMELGSMEKTKLGVGGLELGFMEKGKIRLKRVVLWKLIPQKTKHGVGARLVFM